MSVPNPGLAYDVICKASDTGPVILCHARTLAKSDRAQFLVNAARHLLSYRDQADAYARLPSQPGLKFESSHNPQYPMLQHHIR